MTGDFKKKLLKVSPFFRVDTDKAVENEHGQRMCGLYFTDLHVCSVPIPVVPDRDFRKESGAVDSMGLRTILEIVVKKGCAPQSKVERVFGIDLGLLRLDLSAMKVFRENLYNFRRERGLM